MAAWWSGDVADLLATRARGDRATPGAASGRDPPPQSRHPASRVAAADRSVADGAAGLPEHLAHPVRISAASAGTADRCRPADRARHCRAGVQGRRHVDQRARSPADRGLRARSLRLPRRKPDPSGRADPGGDRGAASATRVAAAVARCDAGVCGVCATLGSLLRDIVARIPATVQAFDARAWEAAPYRPVPTIVEAATMLYNRHGVTEIAEARADVGNLGRTTDAIRRAVDTARAELRPSTYCSSPAYLAPARRCAA